MVGPVCQRSALGWLSVTPLGRKPGVIRRSGQILPVVRQSAVWRLPRCRGGRPVIRDCGRAACQAPPRPGCLPGPDRGNGQDQGDQVVADLPAAEGQHGLLDGGGGLVCGHVVQGGEDLAEAVVAVQVTVGRAAGLGDAVGEQDQAVPGSQQHPRVM
jgi:hypothetical protein